MARDPRKGGSRSKTPSKKGLPRRKAASRSAPKRARKSAAKVKAKAMSAKTARANRGGTAALKRELNEARARQAATVEILKIIASSPSDVKPVFNAIVRTVLRVMRCDRAFIMRCEGGFYFPVARAALDGSFVELTSGSQPIDPEANFPSRAMVTKKTLYYPDRSLIDLPEYERGINEQFGVKASVFLPLLRQHVCIGVLALASKSINAFSPSDIALAESFRDQALIAIENARLFNETREALERQTATADILKVIASSPDDVQPVFEAIAESARRVVGAWSATVTRVVGDRIHLAAFTTTSETGRETLTSMYPQSFSAPTVSGQVARSGRVVMYADTEREGDDTTREVARARGFRSVVGVPMLRDDTVIGTINVTKVEPGAFGENAVGLLKTFADQAVIAIENTRLFNETKEALARQTATADVLKVIASSPSNLQPVFDAIAERSNALMHGHSTTVLRLVGDTIELAAFTPVSEEADRVLRAGFPRPRSTMWGLDRAFRGEVQETIDSQADTEPESSRNIALARGFRGRLVIPLRSDIGVIGAISITRKQPGRFAEKDRELLQTFADQAVIAIQNVELFQEVQRRTRDLQESLQQQTATSEVLKVISRSAFDLQTVLNTLVESAVRLCEADEGIIVQSKGDGYGLSADWGLTEAKREFLRSITFRPDDGRLTGTVLKTSKVVHVHDVLAEPGFLIGGDPDPARTRLGVPLLRDGIPVGVFVLSRGQNVRPFTDRQIELVETYAAQAVIAVQNARLFNETKEALERQTATADILKVIASSPDDVQPVFNAIAERSNRLVNGLSTAVYSLVGDMVHLRSFTPINATADAALRATFPAQLSEIWWWHEGPGVDEVLFVEDAEVTFEKRPSSLNLARLRGWRSWMLVPLLSDGRAIGFITVTRVEPGRFDDHHVQMLKTFADQAVIAISNVELFQQVQQRTRELSQSLDDLRAAQDRLVQTEKLASLGQLTAGIAHEIKNPLNFVNNFSALSVELTDELNEVLRQAEVAEKIRQEVGELTQMLKSNLEKVVQHGKRADSIVKNMLLHSREGSGERRSVDINALVEESLNLAYHGARAERSDFRIRLERELDPGAGQVELYPQEVTRALLNMISNGFYAATKRARETGNGFEPTLLAATRGLVDRVEIRIRDNGAGIPFGVKDKMFNPFFTTKPAGEGTGLGLTMSHDIVVKQHGGTIDVETEAGRFTEFVITLPRVNPVRR